MPNNHSFFNRFAAFVLASIFCFGATLITTNAKAQAPCTCLTVATSVANFCDTCHDSIVVHGMPPHQIADTFVICDTCYTFVITNNCSYGIQALQIFDSASGGGLKQLHHGCSVVEYAAQDTLG